MSSGSWCPSGLAMFEERTRQLEAMLKSTDLRNVRRRQALVGLLQGTTARAASRITPCSDALRLIGDRKITLLVSVLGTGVYRNGELRRAVNALGRLFDEPPISQRMLTLRLRALERDGLVMRSLSSGSSPGVNYRLTDIGESFGGHMRSMTDWSATFEERIHCAQRAFDSQRPSPGRRRTASDDRVA